MRERLGRVVINPEDLSKQEVLVAITYSTSLIFEKFSNLTSAQGNSEYLTFKADSLLLELLSGFTTSEAEIRISRLRDSRASDCQFVYSGWYRLALAKQDISTGGFYYTVASGSGERRPVCAPESSLERVWAIMEDLKTLELALSDSVLPALHRPV